MRTPHRPSRWGVRTLSELPSCGRPLKRHRKSPTLTRFPQACIPSVPASFRAAQGFVWTKDTPSPHGTRGQKVRHLPGGSSDLIHRCFCPLDCNWKYINTSHNISSLLKRLHRMFCKHHGQTIQSLNFLNKSFLLPLYHKAHCNK